MCVSITESINSARDMQEIKHNLHEKHKDTVHKDIYVYLSRLKSRPKKSVFRTFSVIFLT